MLQDLGVLIAIAALSLSMASAMVFTRTSEDPKARQNVPKVLVNRPRFENASPKSLTKCPNGPLQITPTILTMLPQSPA